MNFLNTSCCRRFAGTLGSSGRGSAENFWPETAPASISCCMRSYTGCRTPRPKDVTRWLYRLVTGTIFSAWNASPNMTSVFMTLAMVSPRLPSRIACCSSVRIMPMMDLPPFSFLYFCRPAGLRDSERECLARPAQGLAVIDRHGPDQRAQICRARGLDARMHGQLRKADVHARDGDLRRGDGAER